LEPNRILPLVASQVLFKVRVSDGEVPPQICCPALWPAAQVYCGMSARTDPRVVFTVVPPVLATGIMSVSAGAPSVVSSRILICPIAAEQNSSRAARAGKSLRIEVLLVAGDGVARVVGQHLVVVGQERLLADLELAAPEVDRR